MGLFGGSKSSQSASTGQSGAQTQAGHPTSITVAGGKYTSAHIQVKNTVTDFGAVAESFNFGKEVLKESLALASNAVLTAKESSENALGEIARYTEQANEDTTEKMIQLMPWVIGGLGLAALAGGKLKG